MIPRGGGALDPPRGRTGASWRTLDASTDPAAGPPIRMSADAARAAAVAPGRRAAAAPRASGPADTVAPSRRPWRVLVVDDDEDIRLISRLVLRECRFDGCPIEVLEAASAEQARAILRDNTDIALLLLDVVMESEHAGLELVDWVRKVLGDHAVRIVLRTGQPGQAPPLEVFARYAIDDYRAKIELTSDRLQLLVLSSLRAYRQNGALMETNRELERFAYAASHDLQTPLRSIVSFTQLLQRHLGDADPVAAEMLSYVIGGTRDLQRLVDALLQYSRVGARGEPELLPLGDVVRRALARLRLLVEERGAQVRVGILPSVPGIAVHLEQLFANLVENAIKYQPGPAPVVEIGAERAGTDWVVRVQDRGVGIPAEHLERVFEPFTRLHRADQVAGSGIGLATCRRIVELHGGTLRAESAPGEGTTMVVTLPGVAAKPPV
jgi:signal transduction histidine kinase